MANEAQWWCYFSACNCAGLAHIMVLNVEECGRMGAGLEGKSPGMPGRCAGLAENGQERTRTQPNCGGGGLLRPHRAGNSNFTSHERKSAIFVRTHGNLREPTRMHKKVQEWMGNIKGWPRTQNISNTMPEECVTRSLKFIYCAHSYYFTPMCNGGIMVAHWLTYFMLRILLKYR